MKLISKSGFSLFLAFFCVVSLDVFSVAHAAGSDAASLSDPWGTGRPAHRDDPILAALSTRIFLHGYYRMRFSLLENLDLNRGPTPGTGKSIFPTRPDDNGPLQTGNMRFRTDLTIEIARSVRVIARIDALDNLVLGSTPDALPRNERVPMVVASTRQNPPVQGRNAFIDSIQLKRAYGEVLLPFGYLAAGRMGALTPWGLGILVHAGDALDSDNGDVADRVSLGLALLGHLLIATYEFSASGPVLGVPYNAPVDQDPRDDVRSFAIALARYDSPASMKRQLQAGRSIVNYGLIFSYRGQQRDAPSWTTDGPQDRAYQSGEWVVRDAWSVLLDFWFLVRTPWMRIELEAVYAQGGIANGSLVPGVTLTRSLLSQQFGGVLQFAFAPPKSVWGVGLEVGLASGDDAPGFGTTSAPGQLRTVPGDMNGPQINYPKDTTANNLRFHPDYRIDLIFWRRIVGQVTDALYFKGAGHLDITPRLRFWASVVYSRAMESTTPPGGSAELGVEVDAGLRYDYDPGFELQLTAGVFVPFAGLRNSVLGLEPQPALALQLVLGYVF